MADYQTGDYQSTIDYRSTIKKLPTIDYASFKLCPLRGVECSRRHCAWYDERQEWCAVLSMARR